MRLWAGCVLLDPWFDGFVVLTQIIQLGEHTMSLTILETAVHREPISQNQYRVFFRVQHGAGVTNVRAIDVSIPSSQSEPYNSGRVTGHQIHIASYNSRWNEPNR